MKVRAWWWAAAFAVVWCIGADVHRLGAAEAGCPSELGGKKVAVLLGSGSMDATEELLRDVIAVLEHQLLERGFQIVDQATVAKIIPEREKQLLLRGDTVGAVTLGEKLGADLLLTGQLTVNVRAMEGMKTTLKSVYVIITTKLLHAKTAEAIATKSWSGKSAGVNTAQTVLGLVEKQGPSMVEEIYGEYCTRGPTVFQSRGDAPSETPGHVVTPGEVSPKEGDVKEEKSPPSIRPEEESPPSTSLDKL